MRNERAADESGNPEKQGAMTDHDLDRCAETGVAAALAAGDLLRRRFRTSMEITRKGAINLVTEVDMATEDLVVSLLKREFPEHGVLAEERYAEAERAPVTWIIDPLDGTTNYARGFPSFAVSIGLEICGELEFGVVYNPVLRELFTARRGKGACLNEKPIRVSAVDRLDSGFLTTGFPYDIRTSSETNLEHFAEFSVRALAVRRGGSAAMDFCYVAAGIFDGFWELRLRPWDCAAGYLMVREAGGTVTDFSGRQGSIDDRECLATNGLIHGAMLTILRESRGRPTPSEDCGAD